MPLVFEFCVAKLVISNLFHTYKYNLCFCLVVKNLYYSRKRRTQFKKYADFLSLRSNQTPNLCSGNPLLKGEIILVTQGRTT
jgi:hypothetical protein